MFDRILVLLDGSGFSEAVLPPAEAIARAAGGEIRLLSVLEMPPIFAYPEYRSEDRIRREGYLERMVGALAEAGVPASTRVREGHVAAEIAAEAAEWKASVLCMTTHGRGGLSRVWLGSVTDQCVRTVERPVLLIRPEEEVVDAPPRFALRRILVPLDGSELAEGALPAAARLGTLLGVPLELVSVVDSAPSATSAADPEDADDARGLARARTDAESYLGGVARRLSVDGTPTTHRLLVGSRAARTIVDEAGDDLIAMSPRGIGGLKRSLLGSVSDKVARAAQGPVLLVPAKHT